MKLHTHTSLSVFVPRALLLLAIAFSAASFMPAFAQAQYSASPIKWLDGGTYAPAQQVDDCSVYAAGMPACGNMATGGSYPASRFNIQGQCYVETTYGGGSCSIMGRTSTNIYGSCWVSNSWHSGPSVMVYSEWVHNGGELGQICPREAASAGYQYWNEEIMFTFQPGDAGSEVANVRCFGVANPTGTVNKPVIYGPWNTNSSPMTRPETHYRRGGGSCTPAQPNLRAGNTTPTSATVGTAVSLKTTVSNAGASTAAASRTRFQISTSSSGSSPTNIGDVTTSSINAGASRAVTRSYAFTSARTWYVRACTDIQDVVDESNENDNCSAWRAVTVAAGTLPTATLTAAPTSIAHGNSSTLTWSSTNSQYCESADFNTGGRTSGTATVQPSATKTYEITCTGASSATGSYAGNPSYMLSDLYCAGPGTTWSYSFQGYVNSDLPICPTSPVGKACTSDCRKQQFQTGDPQLGPEYYRVPNGSHGEICMHETEVYSCVGASGAARSATASAQVAVSGRANFVASSITPNIVTSDPTAFRANVTNSGTANAGATVTRFQRATSAAGAGATNIGDVSTSAANIGVTRAVTRTVALPVGTSYVRACADHGNAVAESNEGDNCGAWTQITVWPSASARPDLTASLITPIVAVANTATTFSTSVSNIGGGPTDMPVVPPGGGNCGPAGCGHMIFLDTLKLGWLGNLLPQADIAYAAQSIPIVFQRATSAAGANATALGTTNMDTLAAGAARAVSRSATLAAGTWYLRACADFHTGGSSYGIVLEGNEDNNCGPWTRVDVAPPTPPSVACTVSPTRVTAGETVTYRANPAGGATTPFTWTPSSGSVSGSGATLTRTLTTPGNHGMSVRAAGTNTSHCPTVSVDAAWCTTGAPALEITAAPMRVRAGESVVISWDASGVLGEESACTVTGTDGFSASETVSAAPECSTSGSETRQINTQTTYTIRCGSTEESVTVNVIPNFEEF